MPVAAPRERALPDDFDDSDPTYTHFQHRDEFAGLLAKLLAIDLAHAPTDTEDKDETSLVTQLGGIVSVRPSPELTLA